MIAIVLVGGKPSVSSDSHSEIPPSLIHVAGRPFLYWVTQWLKTQGFKHIVYSAGLYASKIEAFAQDLASKEPNLCLDVVMESRPLGTGGGAALCANRYPSTITYVVNGNSMLLANMGLLRHRLQENIHLDGIILGVNVTNAGRFGTLEVDPDNQLLSFREKQPGNGLANAGAYLLRNELLSEITPDKETSLEYDWFPQWLKEDKRILVLDEPAPFIDIGTPEHLKRAHEQIAQFQATITGQKESLVA